MKYPARYIGLMLSNHIAAHYLTVHCVRIYFEEWPHKEGRKEDLLIPGSQQG